MEDESVFCELESLLNSLRDLVDDRASLAILVIAILAELYVDPEKNGRASQGSQFAQKLI
jgi:hypothetical protein